MANRAKLLHSKSEANRAGNAIRAFVQDPTYGQEGMRVNGRPTPAEMQTAFRVLYNWRACHAYPLGKAAMGLRSMVRTSGAEPADVAQRLKRFVTIVNKLAREPGMDLARMSDVGGCRAVVPNVAAVRKVQHLDSANNRRCGRPSRVRDYLEEPRPSGYRAVHVFVVYDDRTIEVQLRTPIQNEWANTVERVGHRIGHDLKSGTGPAEWLEFFAFASDLMDRDARGNTISPAEHERLKDLREQALRSDQ